MTSAGKRPADRLTLPRSSSLLKGFVVADLPPNAHIFEQEGKRFAFVGEAGPELLDLPSGTRIQPHVATEEEDVD